MLGGLILNLSTTAQEQLPWVGDVPVLGALFRSASYQKNETDLAIIVTPRIVKPARRRDQDAARQEPTGERRRPLPDGQAGDHANRRAARAWPPAAVRRPHPRFAKKGRRQCRRQQELVSCANSWRRRSPPPRFRPFSAPPPVSTTHGP